MDNPQLSWCCRGGDTVGCHVSSAATVLQNVFHNHIHLLILKKTKTLTHLVPGVSAKREIRNFVFWFPAYNFILGLCVLVLSSNICSLTFLVHLEMPLTSHFSLYFARSAKSIPLNLSSWFSFSPDLFLLCTGSCFTSVLLNINDCNCT